MKQATLLDMTFGFAENSECSNAPIIFFGVVSAVDT
jgi:hypothetical protein